MKKEWNWRARLQAAGAHLILSGLVALAAAALVLEIWYPMPYREVSGGRELFLLLVSVDMVVGPLLTLAIFDRSKGRTVLRRDLTVIALVQLGALGYGLHTVWHARPVYLVHEVDRFRVVRAVDLETQDLKQAPSELQALPWSGPRIIGTRRPQDEQEKLESIELALTGVDIGMRPAYWKPYADARADVVARARSLSEWRQRHPERAAEVEGVVKQTGLPLEQLAYLPLMSIKSDWVMVVHAQTGDVVGHAPFDGFE